MLLARLSEVRAHSENANRFLAHKNPTQSKEASDCGTATEAIWYSGSPYLGTFCEVNVCSASNGKSPPKNNMSTKSTAPLIDIDDIPPVPQWFHNELINVYPTTVAFESVTYWPENFRTELDFELLSQQKKKPLSKLTVDEITDYLAQQSLKISQLAASIERNGVRVPIIVLSDGTLLDGNRRFFACAYLKKRKAGQPRPPVLDRIPVWVIKEEDLDQRKRAKILAEMNFVTDLKMDWPDSVKARLVAELYRRCRKEKKSEQEAYDEIRELYATDSATAKAYIQTIDLTAKFVSGGGIPKKDDYRMIVQKKFVYFWEFRNKAASLDKRKELPKVRKLFFKMIANNRISNLKQIEPIIWAVGQEYEWELLESSGGSKIGQVEALFKEDKAIKSTEEKIRGFYRWLKKTKPESLTDDARNLLTDVAKLCQSAAQS